MSASSSAVPFRDAASRRRIDALAPAIIHNSSRNYAWPGIVAEIGSHQGWIVDDLVVDGYYLAINIDTEPLAIESRERGRFIRQLVPPGTLVVHPYGESFSFRVPEGARWAGVVIDPCLVREEFGGQLIGAAAQFGTSDRVLLSNVEFAVQQLEAGNSGALGASQAAAALAAHLAGPSYTQRVVRRAGGLSPAHLRKVADFVEGHLGDRIVLEHLAAIVQLSPWHFARAFKAQTGLSPHQFVITRRLTRARLLLSSTSDPIALISTVCGFSDQAHLTRCFRSHYRVTPAAYRRRRIG